MIDKKIYKNGLTVIKSLIPDSLSAVFGVFVKAGTRNETKDNFGCAHFLEHMFFKGTATKTGRELAESMDEIGGIINAFTSHDYTCFYSHSLSEDCSYAYDVISDMLLNSLFDKGEIEKEKKVIFEEMNMYEDEPGGLVVETFTKKLFVGTPLSNSILGTVESLKSINQEKLLDFFNKYYRPENIIIVLAGHFNEEDLTKKIENTFGKMAKGAFKDAPLIETSGIKPFNYHAIMKEDVTQVNFALGCLGVAKTHSNYYALELLSTLLGEGSSSYLFLQIRDALGLCYDIGSFNSSFYETGELVIHGATSIESFPKVLKTVAELLDDMVKNSVNEGAFLRGKKQMVSQIVLASEGILSKLRLGNNFLYNGREVPVSEAKNLIESIPYADFNLFVKGFLKRENMSLSLVGPKGMENFKEKWRLTQWGN
ncbi:hypothetical protein AZF37_03820 [endosymbiont 'TC1' of Trimyema compressum]|uniref:M16 family metallopeptidase n=1 Tax=endosymbiont 'TC1' of Trimyema compressum TaxID=243899 RepID=UPI0007F0AC93|nr:pitrilysin family protein [endosymbiont 'TC1' of Trimyema compressum]AMP20412.1 hypothetical protein AZF37_03820 [endosymbiont 'TC1' of Trimyema compressum]